MLIFSPKNAPTAEPLIMYNRVGISVGDMYAIHVGNANRTEFLVAGEPLHQLAPTIEAAQIKTVVLSAKAYEFVKNFCKDWTRTTNGCWQVGAVENQHLLSSFPPTGAPDLAGQRESSKILMR